MLPDLARIGSEVGFMFEKLPHSDEEPDFGKGSILYPILPLLLSIYYKFDYMFVDWNIQRHLPNSPWYNDLQVRGWSIFNMRVQLS